MDVSNRHRVAVTGFGAVTDCGPSSSDLWDQIVSGSPPTSRLPELLTADDLPMTKREARRIGTFSLYAIVAAVEAVKMAGYEFQLGDFNSGIHVGTAVGGVVIWEDATLVEADEGPEFVPPLTTARGMTNAATSNMSIHFGIQGPCECSSIACASGTASIVRAAQMIADGRVDRMLAGGTEEPRSATFHAAFASMGANSPTATSRPFDNNRDGLVISGGAGILFLERWDLAVARGATILAEIGGGSCTADASHLTAPSEGREAAVAAMKLAIEDAGLVPEDITYVNAHGTATLLNDRLESASIYDVLGGNVPVTSIKGVTGHPIGAAGAIEAVSIVMSMQYGLIPPTAGYKTPDPAVAAIDIVAGEARQWTPGPTLSNSLGFGGHNSCLIIKPADHIEGAS